MTRIVILSVILLLISGLVSAQRTLLKGIVIDDITQQYIPFATISVYNNIELIDGVSTDENGKFQLFAKDMFSHIDISYIGYNPLRLMLSDLTDPKNLVIALTIDTTMLEAIVVTGKRATTQLKIDRKVINLSADIQQSGGSALEAFSLLPEVQTDIVTGTISLRGNSNVRVLVNGKPSSLNAIELLQQIAAFSIDRVEIITSPSSRYNADGLSGIINVILKRDDYLGLNLGLNTSIGTRRHSFALNGNYNISFANFRLNASKFVRTETNSQSIHRQFANGYAENISTLYEFDGTVYKIISGLDFFIKDKHEFSFELDYSNDSHSYINNSSYYDIVGRDDYGYLRENTHLHYVTIFNANYRFKIDNDLHYLELDYNINSSNNSYPLSDFEEGILLFDQLLREDFTLQSIAIDYTVPIRDGLNIEAGISINSQLLDSRNSFTPVRDTTTSDHFTYDESLFGVYGLGKFSIGDANFQAGLRFEYFTSNSNGSRNSFVTSQKFSNLFPSIHVSYPIDDANTLSFGYAKRISRPDFHHINALQLASPLFVWEYNPNITPEVSDNIELNFQRYSQGFKLGVTGFYRYRNNAILWTSISENSIQVFRYENSGIFNSYGLETTIGGEVTPFWDTRLTANYYFTKINQSSSVTWDRIHSSSIQVKNTFEVCDRLTMDIAYLYSPKRQRAFDYIAPRSRLDLTFNGQLFNNRLSVNLRIVDVLDNNILNITNETGNLIQNTTWDIQSQTLNYLLSINCNIFEKKERSRRRKNRDYNPSPID